MNLLKFSSETCNPCKMLSKFLDDNKIPHNEIMLENDVENLMGKYNIRSFPTLIKLNDEGNEIGRIEGFNPIKIKEFI